MTAASPRLPFEIDAHLMLAALEGACVGLRRGQESVRGRLDLPDDFGEVGFIAEGSREAMRSWGTHDEVVARYHINDQPFQFRSRIRSRGSDWRLRLDRPRSVASVERRLCPRILLPSTIAAVLRLDEGPMPVVDLSNQGARLRWADPATRPRVGARRPAWLESSLVEPVSLELEVRRIDDDLLGVAFRGMRPRDLRALTTALYQNSELPTEEIRSRAAG